MDWNKTVGRSDLVSGDHIYVFYPDGCTHHGIFIGEDGVEVIHFWQEPKPRQQPPNNQSCGGDNSARQQATCAYGSQLEEVVPPVKSCPLGFFQYLATDGSVSGSKDLPAIRRYRYGATRLQTKLINTQGTCTTLMQRSAASIVATAKWFLRHPDRFGAFIPESRNSEHFAVYCATSQQTLSDLDQGEEPKVPDLVTTADRYTATVSPASQKSRVAVVAGATCGVLAAGTLWSLAPAVALGGAVYATTKYVQNRGTVKEEEKRKKND